MDSLISKAKDRLEVVTEPQDSARRTAKVESAKIVANPWQPRRQFDTQPLNDLVESLRQHGLMQPIVLRPRGDSYELIAGERRWRASQELGWDHIDAVLVDATDRDMIEWALVENLQRDDLNPIELGISFRQLMREHDLTQAEVAKVVGMSRPAVANTLRLLELPQSIQDHVSRGTLTAGAARALLGIHDPELQASTAERAVAGELTVREIEQAGQPTRAAPTAKTREAPPRKTADEIHMKDLQRELCDALGVPVRITGTLRKGSISLQYATPEILDGLIKAVRRLRFDADPVEDEGDSSPLNV